MAAKSKTLKNCFLINAPAGSGKTTRIENKVLNILGDNKNLNVLCITYTNRAAEELMGRLDSDKVQISTIHSFINQFINVYFSHQEIINLYFEIFGDKIKERIESKVPVTSRNLSNFVGDYD